MVLLTKPSELLTAVMLGNDTERTSWKVALWAHCKSGNEARTPLALNDTVKMLETVCNPTVTSRKYRLLLMSKVATFWTLIPFSEVNPVSEMITSWAELTSLGKFRAVSAGSVIHWMEPTEVSSGKSKLLRVVAIWILNSLEIDLRLGAEIEVSNEELETDKEPFKVLIPLITGLGNDGSMVMSPEKVLHELMLSKSDCDLAVTEVEQVL